MLLGKKQWALNPGLASEPIPLDPKIFDADFNDLAKSVSFTVQENTQKLKGDIYNN